MKIRNGFVSNSSSSSFIVINNENIFFESLDKNTLLIPDDFGGETEFGWEVEDYRDFGSKLNFAYIQTTYVNKELKEKWISMLEKVLKEKLHINNVVVNLTEEWNPEEKNKKWGYIDHQSCAVEGKNTEMFDSKENLIAFLFSGNSYIHTDNDNY